MRDPGPVLAALECGHGLGEDNDLEIEIMAPNSDCTHAELRIRPMAGESAPFGLVLALTDVTTTIALRQQLVTLSRTDHLTQVLNRLGLEEELERPLSSDRLTDLRTCASVGVAVAQPGDNFDSIVA